jgi:transposase
MRHVSSQLTKLSGENGREKCWDPYKERVEALLHQNEQMPRKQHYTVHRIFEVIQAEGYQGSESRLRQYVATRRSATQIPQVFLPLEFEPGQDAQVDWGEAMATIGGQKQKVQLFVMHLCYSRRTYAACFPSQNQESFLWAHIQAFRHFGGVPRRISYDNLATAVKLIVDKTKKRGRSRQEARAFTSFRGYYLFESHFCTPAKGNEKGGVKCLHNWWGMRAVTTSYRFQRVLTWKPSTLTSGRTAS